MNSRRLASAVRPEQAQDFTDLEMEGDAPESLHSAEGLGQILNLDYPFTGQKATCSDGYWFRPTEEILGPGGGQFKAKGSRYLSSRLKVILLQLLGHVPADEVIADAGRGWLDAVEAAGHHGQGIGDK